jgi:hypothetical protein
MNETFVDQSSHQKTALDFMSQRENGPIPEEYQLWKPHEREGQSWYVIAVSLDSLRSFLDCALLSSCSHELQKQTFSLRCVESTRYQQSEPRI